MAIHPHHWRIQGERPPPRGPNSFIFMQFSAKNWKILAILGVGVPPWGKSWIPHCSFTWWRDWFGNLIGGGAVRSDSIRFCDLWIPYCREFFTSWLRHEIYMSVVFFILKFLWKNTPVLIQWLQSLFVPFAWVGSGDPVRVLRLYTTNTLDTLWSIYCWDICTTCHYQSYVLLYWLIRSRWLTDLVLYCAVPYIAACVDVSRTVFRDRSYSADLIPNNS